MGKADGFFLVGIGILVVAVLCSTAWLFLYQKNYTFIVEAACDSTYQNCFHRDCEAGDCPVNELSDYRVYHISAKDFQVCANDSCSEECVNGIAKCTEILCGDSQQDSCSQNPEAGVQ